MRAKWAAALVGGIALVGQTAGAQVAVEAPRDEVNANNSDVIEVATGVWAVRDDMTNAREIVVGDLSGGPFWPGGPRPTDPAQFTWPGGATSAGVTGPSNSRYNPSFGQGYDGVGRLLMSTNGVLTSGCSGSLISDRIVLTAAHCVSNTQGQITATSVDVSFRNAQGGVTTYTARREGIFTFNGYTGSVVDERDLAVLYLDTPSVDPSIPRYQIYAGNPLFQEVEFVGYGLTGNGVSGGIISTTFDAVPTLRVGKNRYELYRDAQFLYAGDTPEIPILVADFDGADPGGTFAVPRANAQGQLVTGWATRSLFLNDVNCRAFDASATLDPALRAKICDEGFGLFEGFTASGDSGGGNFIRVNGQLQLVSVTSFGNVACYPDQRLNPAGVPSPRSDAGCPAGFVQIGSRFGFRNGHVWAGGDIQSAFIQNALTAPEPSTYALMATGLVGVAFAGYRRRKGSN